MRSCSDIGRQDGFVFAPFSPTADTPILLFDSRRRFNSRLDRESIFHFLSAHCRTNTGDLNRFAGHHYDKNSYTEDFRLFVESMKRGCTDKIVLSRSACIPLSEDMDVVGMFLKACRNAPVSFVALVSSAATGTWLVSTPELLLEKNADTFHTVALAGTMDRSLAAGCPAGEDGLSIWSKKNRVEQRYVCSYIADRLKGVFNAVEEIGPYTVTAGNVVHLKSDFYARSCRGTDISTGRVVALLHPTPAVCGVPAEAAYHAISRMEHNDRRYYSGFCGEVEASGSCRLFVTLRCMEIFSNCCRLYAGGGILAESDMEEEWKETELKMKAMQDCLSQDKET